jgi:hypothetical protein
MEMVHLVRAVMVVLEVVHQMVGTLFGLEG